MAIKKSFADVVKGSATAKKPELEFSKNGKLVGKRHYGPNVINIKKNENPPFVDAIPSKDTIEEGYCIVS